METEELRTILDEFLARWPDAEVEKMTLSDYVDVSNQDTFCQWVETRTRPLGSIKGLPSIKFGIYRRKKKDKRPKNYQNDDEYSWLARFGTNHKEAFAAVKREISQVIRFAESGDFNKIDDLRIPDLFKWKVASLYSNERLVPIFKRDVLNAAASGLGMRNGNKTKISEIHELLIRNKPAEQDIYHYMWELFFQYGKGGDVDHEREKIKELAAKRRIAQRKSAAHKNTEPQIRVVSRSYIATQKHNQIQEALKRRLIDQHGEKAVLMEENFVDVKLVLPDQIVFYEVKSSSYASDCIREALGQVLAYTFHEKDNRKRKIVVVGQYPPNRSEEEFIKFIKSQIKIEFDYENVEI
jgi:hypothetical protein